jgi:2-amino-4-hydroxy-6-hydroxymethyldihydropteridine diphosphokinase
MILLGLGGNLPSKAGPPDATISAAIEALDQAGVKIIKRSRLYRTAPVPVSDQPWFANEVIAVRTKLPPRDLLALLHKIEAEFGRERREVNGARSLDIDLLAYDGKVRAGGDGEPILPHPRMTQRAFVLLPLREVAPRWRHPITGESVKRLIAMLPKDQVAEPILD